MWHTSFNMDLQTSSSPWSFTQTFSLLTRGEGGGTPLSDLSVQGWQLPLSNALSPPEPLKQFASPWLWFPTASTSYPAYGGNKLLLS